MSKNETCSSDSDSYINLDSLVAEKLVNIYQPQLNNKTIEFKHIANSSDVPDIIIKTDFGRNKNLNLYSCVYKESEINFLTQKMDSEKFLPIIKLIEKQDNKENIYTLSVKITELLEYNKKFESFNLFLTIKENNFIKYNLIAKEITCENIVEKFLTHIIELGIKIL